LQREVTCNSIAWKNHSARTTAAAMDVPTSVTETEERALAEIARELGVDNGESWAALVRELEKAN
jgi:hypothetical protein